METIHWRRLAPRSLGPALAAGLLALPVLAGAVDAGPWQAASPAGRAALAAGPPDVCLALATRPEPSGTWQRMDPVLDAAGRMTGLRLSVGAGDVTRRLMELPSESWADGPVRGRVVLAEDDGRRSRLTLLDTVEDCRIELGETDDVVRRVALVPGHDAIVEFRVDRRTRADRGTWLRPISGGEPRRILEPLADPGRVGRVSTTSLVAGPDGSAVAVVSCGEAECLTRVVDLASGGVNRIDDPAFGEVVGFAGEHLIGYASCRAWPCDLRRVDLRTGEIAPFASSAVAADVRGTATDRFVVAQLANGRVVTFDIGGHVLGAVEPTGTQALIAGGGRALGGLDLAPESIPLATDARPGPGLARDLPARTDARPISAEEVTR